MTLVTTKLGTNCRERKFKAACLSFRNGIWIKFVLGNWLIFRRLPVLRFNGFYRCIRDVILTGILAIIRKFHNFPFWALAFGVRYFVFHGHLLAMVCSL